MISKEAILEILGIKGNIRTSTLDMANDLKVTFFPKLGKNVTEDLISFSNDLKDTFITLGVKILEYEDCLENVSLYKRIRRVCLILIQNLRYYTFYFIKREKASFPIGLSALGRVVKRKRLKKGVSVIALGELDSDFLPMQFISSFKSNSVINILSFPVESYESSDFNTHYDKAMSLFAYHMANIIIGVSSKKWILYNFNASHPIFDRFNNFTENVKQALIPKIYAPISPNLLSEFRIIGERFDPRDEINYPIVSDILALSRAFAQTSLFPEGKKINDLPFRDNFHKFIGKIHLDNRNGMSFGFISKQMPTSISRVNYMEKTINSEMSVSDFFYDTNQDLNIALNLNIKGNKGRVFMKVPDVWVMTLRSGSDKTNFDADKDLLKIGLKNGEMYMQFPKGVKISGDYRPSFDTKVILAQAVGNSIIASIIKHINPVAKFVDVLEKKGISIVHWHGYLNPGVQINGLYNYGHENPHVACSSPQSAVYSLDGKLKNFFDHIESDNLLLGHVHIEPHHGINISHIDMLSLANDIIGSPNYYTSLGNEYLEK